MKSLDKKSKKKSMVGAVVKGTLKYFVKLIGSLVVLVLLLSFFSALFHISLTDKVVEMWELRKVYSQQEGFVGAMLDWKILVFVFIVPNLFLWGHEIYIEYNGRNLI